MTDHADWQGESPGPSGSQMIAAEMNARGSGSQRQVSADSFKALMARLKQPASLATSIQIPPISQPTVLPVELPPVQTFEPPPVTAPVEVFAEPVAVAEPPAIEVAEPSPIVPSLKIAIPPILPAPAPVTAPDPILALEVSVIESAAAEPAPVYVRRPVVDPELEAVMRMIVASPSTEDRIKFLDEAAALVVEDQRKARPEGELAALEDAYLQSLETEAPMDVPVEAPPQAPTVEEKSFTPSRPPSMFDGVSLEDHPEEDTVDVGGSLSAPPMGIPISRNIRPSEPSVKQTEHQAAAVFANAIQNLPTPLEKSNSPLANLGEAEASELARSLLDMMASGTSSGLPQERALAADTLLRLVPRLPTKPLILLSERLSMMDNPPQMLLAKLIRDPRIEVSGALLENAQHITDQDLAAVVAERNVSKLRMIARRRKLSHEISDQLVATGDSSVMLTLVRNAPAEISHGAFQKLCDAAAHETDLLAPLCTRADLPAPFAFELFWVAPVQLRRYILSRFLTDSETLTKILKITLATQGGDGASEHSFPSVAGLRATIKLLEAGDMTVSCENLASMLNISPDTVARIIGDEQGEPLAVMLKAAGCPRTEFESFIRTLSEAALPTLAEGKKAEELQALFGSLSFNKARILLTYWDWAVRKSGPYAPLH